MTRELSVPAEPEGAIRSDTHPFLVGGSNLGLFRYLPGLASLVFDLRLPVPFGKGDAGCIVDSAGPGLFGQDHDRAAADLFLVKGILLKQLGV